MMTAFDVVGAVRTQGDEGGMLGMVSTSAGAFVLDSALALSALRRVELLVPRDRIEDAADLQWFRSRRMKGLGAPSVIPLSFPALFRTREGRARLFSQGAVDALESTPGLWADALMASGAMAWHVRRRSAHWQAALAHWLVPSGLVCALNRRLPLVAVAHSGDVHLLGRLGLTQSVIRMMARPGVRLVFTSGFLRDRLTASLSSSLRDWVVSHSKIQPMGLFVGDMGPCPPARRAARCSRFDLPPESKLVVFAGRLEPVKGPDRFVRLAAALARRHKDAIFVMAGEGPMRKSLESQAVGSVRVLGRLGRRDLLDLLSLAHVVVLASRVLPGGRTESAPVIVSEAQASGAALIASDVGGVCELVAHGRDGLLVSPGDDLGLASAVDSVLAQDDLRMKLALAGRSSASKRDWSLVAPRFLSLIQEVAAELDGGLNGR